MTRSAPSKAEKGCLTALVVFVGFVLLVGALSTCADNKTSAPPVGATPANAQAEFDKENTAAVGAMLPCDLAAVRASAAIHGGDRYEAYDVVQGAKNVCMAAWSTIGGIKFSEAIPDAGRKALNDALSACEDAYLSKASAMNEISKVLNGDTKPSDVSQARFEIQNAAVAVSTCLANYKLAALNAGLKLPDASGDSAIPARRRPHRHHHTTGAPNTDVSQ